MIRTTCSLFAVASIAMAQSPVEVAPMQAQPAASVGPEVGAEASSRAIDLVICLDVSGSMNGLINAARQNLWSIINDMATLQPQPELRVALLTFGNPQYGSETGYVSIQTELTTDLDLVSQKLFGLTTNGGDEYVARVIKRSLDDLKWSADPQALKMIFVCGNEAATQDPQLDAMQMASAAIGKGVLVNAIYCNNQQGQVADGWRQVARMADGKFAAIEQNKMVVIETPFDQQLSDLSAQLNKTYLTYGQEGARWGANQVLQDNNAESLNPAAVATRCLTKGGRLYFNPKFDLCDAITDAKFDLKSVKKEDLPKELREMDPAQLRAHVEKLAKQRVKLQKQVAEIGQKRDAYIQEKRKQQAEKGETLFEQAILESVRAQARSRGFERQPVKVEGPVVESPVVETTEAQVPEAGATKPQSSKT